MPGRRTGRQDFRTRPEALHADSHARGELDLKLSNQIAELDLKLSNQIAERSTGATGYGERERLSNQIAELDLRLSNQIAELDRKLTALVAALNATDEIEAALEGRLLDSGAGDDEPSAPGPG